MHLLRSLALTLLSATALGAKGAAVDVYSKYAKKQAASTPLDLTSTAYGELTRLPRDYSLIFILTALDAKYSCGVCKEFDSEWKVIARSWQNADKGQHRVLFGTLDFDKSRDVFTQLKLQTAPVVLAFPPTTGPHASADANPARFDFMGSQSADSVYNWITRQLPPGDYPPLIRPVNYGKIITTVTILLGLFTFGTVIYPYALPVIQNRNLWAAISLMLVLLFTSGHMYNQIRKVPYITTNGKGGINYFAPGFMNQFGMETQIIAAMYGVLSFALIALALKVPRMKDARTQQIACIAWISVLFGMYSFLMSVFRIKNGGYPFWIPPF